MVLQYSPSPKLQVLQRDCRKFSRVHSWTLGWALGKVICCPCPACAQVCPVEATTSQSQIEILPGKYPQLLGVVWGMGLVLGTVPGTLPS
jgi:formate hydrogenlyase subunit 6/NADH:ubiquinone oxidoreductase subunit I